MKFKVGDKVRYKTTEASNAAINGHVEGKVYPIIEIKDNGDFALLEGDEPGGGVFTFRLELVKAAPSKKEKPQGNFTWGMICKSTGILKGTAETRQEARKYAPFYGAYVKKIQYTIVK
jgi:hypothetical protein